MQTLIDAVGPIKVRLDELIDVADGRFVAWTRMGGESAASDPPYTQSFAVVQRLRDGLVIEAEYYLDGGRPVWTTTAVRSGTAALLLWAKSDSGILGGRCRGECPSLKRRGGDMTRSGRQRSAQENG
jgi:hypothetical protein